MARNLNFQYTSHDCLHENNNNKKKSKEDEVAEKNVVYFVDERYIYFQRFSKYVCKSLRHTTHESLYYTFCEVFFFLRFVKGAPVK